MAFYFRLALTLGKTVTELLDSISSIEMAYWLAYYELEPFGPRRKDLRAGQIAALLYNANRGTNPLMEPMDFFEERQDQDVYTMMSVFEATVGIKGSDNG